MSPKQTGHFRTIEYIGPKPQKPKKSPFFGGWVILAISLSAAIFFGKPLLSSVWAADRKPSNIQTQDVIAQLSASDDFPSLLSIEALRHSTTKPQGKQAEASTALVIKCFENLGIDLIKTLHEDMSENFRLYPQLWNADSPDIHLDYQRVPNLQRFFSRKAESLTPSKDPTSYQHGDIVVWALPNAETHIGIVVPAASAHGSDVPWVVHHAPGLGITWEKALFHHQVIGHYRYSVK